MLLVIVKLNSLSIEFAINDITPIQFKAKTLKVVSRFFQKRILMTFDYVRATFL